MIYHRIRALACRGAVDPAPSEEVEGTLLVGTTPILWFDAHETPYGEDRCYIFPASHNSQQCWLRRDVWMPARGYSASGTSEYLLSLEEGVSLLTPHEMFNLEVAPDVD